MMMVGMEKSVMMDHHRFPTQAAPTLIPSAGVCTSAELVAGACSGSVAAAVNV